MIRWGELANEHEPELQRYDRFGHRIDTVEYHPAYHALMTEAVAGGLHAAPWADGRPGAHVVRAARFAVWTQVEAGHGCPISMTYSIVPALRADAGAGGRVGAAADVVAPTTRTTSRRRARPVPSPAWR